MMVMVWLGLCGCRGQQAAPVPSIEFTTIPQAAEGGPDVQADVAGRVIRARPGQRIGLFAKSGVWWVQPLKTDPYTSIERDSTWKNKTHLGFEYAALLVEAGYEPPGTLDELPSAGGG